VSLGLHITKHQQLAQAFAAAQEVAGLIADAILKQPWIEEHATDTAAVNLLIWFRIRSFHGGKLKGSSSSSTPAWPRGSDVPTDALSAVNTMLLHYIERFVLPKSIIIMKKALAAKQASAQVTRLTDSIVAGIPIRPSKADMLLPLDDCALLVLHCSNLGPVLRATADWVAAGSSADTALTGRGADAGNPMALPPVP
jgi:hypothetical protein